MTTDLADKDLSVLVETKPDGLVLPKAEGSGSIAELDRRMRHIKMPSVPVLPLATETARAVFKVCEFADVADRLVGLTWGVEDLSAAIGASTSREPLGRFTTPYEFVRSLVLFAAHAAGISAIETVYPALRDLDGLATYVARAARDGFTGMLAIHPSQVPVINGAFTPLPADLDRAHRIIAAFNAQPGLGVINFEGVMLDAPHYEQARRLLAQADDRSPFELP
jgi:citrate lyase subunit beta/citryl-CoA lyase